MPSNLVSAFLGKPSLRAESNPAHKDYPTLSFPEPPPSGKGNRFCCSRCLTLLSHCLVHFGDGTDYSGLEIIHSTSMVDLSATAKAKLSPAWQRKETMSASAHLSDESVCVICITAAVYFEATRDHTSFESSLRDTHPREWKLKWEICTPNPHHSHLALPHGHLRVSLAIEHIKGNGYGIGGFEVHPDVSVTLPKAASHQTIADNPVIVPLDPGMSGHNDPSPDFSSTRSEGTMALVSSWIHKCTTSHTRCSKLFWNEASASNPKSWLPQRLVRIKAANTTHVLKSGQLSPGITARLVLQSSADFSHEDAAAGIEYISLSHCWGAPPDPNSPLGGRADSVLTHSKLAAWQDDIPLPTLPLTFQHAIAVCAQLGFTHIWIDSLCIIQDSLDDWKLQCAEMAEVYKTATLNIAALSSMSDDAGFLNDARDPRVVFGFRAPFGSILGLHTRERNKDNQECVLLDGMARLLWRASIPVPGTTTWNAPLFERAWVHQERSLARRTLAFTHLGVHWSCDEASCSEDTNPEQVESNESSLRALQHQTASVINTLLSSSQDASLSQVQQATMARELLRTFDMVWHATVTQYTLCRLTKQTDKLVAVSSIAQELANLPIFTDVQYLAGLWALNLLFQLGWITVEGDKTAPRRKQGQAGYVAPSWSWASIDAPVQPQFMLNLGTKIALADVRETKMSLDSAFAFGAVQGGWLRLWGCLRRVSAVQRKTSAYDQSKMVNSLTDGMTGEELWFSSDTTEGIELIGSGQEIDKLVWMPLTLQYVAGCIECSCLVLVEVDFDERAVAAGSFIQDSEKVYRRLGTGNFGMVLGRFRQDRLLMSLGTFPGGEVDADRVEALFQGLSRTKNGYETFVLI